MTKFVEPKSPLAPGEERPMKEHKEQAIEKSSAKLKQESPQLLGGKRRTGGDRSLG
jgi:hypothetical protein